MSNLVQRIIFGVLGGALLIFLISFSKFSFLFFIVIINILGVLEFNKLFGLKRSFITIYILIISSFLLICSFYLVENVLLIKHIFFILPFFFLIFIFQLFKKESLATSILSNHIFSIVYITIPLIFLINIAYFGKGFNPHFVLGTMFLIWANDSGAYFIGKFFGRTKLFERISPKKTWEGSIGGFITSMVTAYVLSIYWVELSTYSWIMVAFVTTVFGGLGDLVESMMKRNLEIKDSGNLIPGHGGILDRFDALFLATPFIYLTLMLPDLYLFLTRIF